MTTVRNLILWVCLLSYSATALGEPLLDPNWDWEYRVAEVQECLQDCCQDWETASYESIPVWVVEELAMSIHPDNIQWRFKDKRYRYLMGECRVDDLMLVTERKRRCVCAASKPL